MGLDDWWMALPSSLMGLSDWGWEMVCVCAFGMEECSQSYRRYSNNAMMKIAGSGSVMFHERLQKPGEGGQLVRILVRQF